MLEPGWSGLRNAFQHAVLFHPAFGQGGDQEQEVGVDQQEQEDQQENEDQQEEVDQQETANGNMTTTTDTMTKYFIRCLVSRGRGGRGGVISMKSKMTTTVKA